MSSETEDLDPAILALNASRVRDTAGSPADGRAGVWWALAAYAWWGIAPVYFKALHDVAPLEVLAHRIVWSVAVLVVLSAVLGRWTTIAQTVRNGRTLSLLTASTLLIAVNWFVFIWAVAHEQVLQASLGYFISPLVSVLLGATMLRERLTRPEWIAVALAAASVAALTLTAGIVPWIALILAGSFALYGLVRKLAGVNATEALTVETALLLPAALAYMAALASRGTLTFGSGSLRTDLLLASAGVITAMPLLWFGLAVRRLRLSTLGILQYVGPTLQFLLAVAVYREPFHTAHKLVFVGIWTALAIFTADNIRRSS